MGSLQNRALLRSTLLAAAAVGAMAPAMASAQADAQTQVRVQSQTLTVQDGGNESQIIGRNGLDRNTLPPGGILDDAGVNGIGQMRTITNRTTLVGGICTGTLINPRAVIFAAHCVNTAPASAYGGGDATIPLSFGFESNNLGPRRIWAGLSEVVGGPAPDPALTFRTNVARHLYTANQVWYDPRSIPTGFLEADIAIATLDTPANNVPTWMMLFSPLTGPTRATITGYGNTGTSATSGANVALDSRRRVAENMIDFLGSLDDKNDLIFGPANRTGVSSLYQLDFDDPDPNRFANFNPSLGRFDFDHFGGVTLDREGTTAGGDLGGPLIVTIGGQRVTTATLSGGSQVGFLNPIAGQPSLFPGFSTYSTTSFYQPLFLYWDAIIANNPYVYATNKGGAGRWLDPAHWVQAMDPNYVIEVDGQLVNALPSVAAQGQAIETPGFGVVSFLGSVIGAAGNTPNLTPAVFVPGGPGTENFVANNDDGNRLTGRRASYYNVTLSAAGNTALDGAATIDEFKIDGPTRLDVQANGSLRVLGEYNHIAGATHVDGLIKSGEALFVTGLLSGSGTFDPTFLTSVGAVIAPGALNGTGTLTIQGDVVLSSVSTLVLDVNRNAQDKLVITGDAQNTGQILLGGTVFFQKNADTPAPRHGQRFDIVTAIGGVTGTFDRVAAFQSFGVLRPELSYLANSVEVNIRAGSVRDYIGPGAGGTAIAFAGALDALRSGSYNNLSGFYGTLDLMDPASLSATLNGLSPRIVNETTALHDRQGSTVVTVIGDRLARLGTAQSKPGTLSVVGSPETLVPGFAYSGSTAAQKSFVNSIVPQATMGALPENMSGFVSGGYEQGRAALAGSSFDGTQQRSWHMAAGLEMAVSDRATLGTAFGFASGSSRLASSQAEIDTTQAAVYGSYHFGGGFYAAGLAAMAQSRIGVQRRASVGLDSFDLRGDTTAANYQLRGEAGVNLPLAQGVTFTPKASLGYSRYHLSGFRENGGEAALRIDDYTQARIEARAGFAVSGETGVVSGWRLAPQLSAEWVQAAGGGANEMTVRFAAADGEAFLLPGFAFDRSYGEVKGGMKLSRGKVSLGAAVQTSVARSDLRDDRAVADLTLRF